MVALAIVALCLVMSLGASPAAHAQAASLGAPHTHSDLVSGKYLPMDKVPATAEVVTVGAFMVNIYGIDFQSNTCFITAYVWFIWRGHADPTATLEFANAVEDWQLKTTKSFVMPTTLPDGSKYQEMRVNGLFYQDYDLRRYPLDTQAIALDLEDGRRAMDEVVFIADRERSGIDAHVQIPGWNIMGLWSQSFAHDYGSTFHLSLIHI